jgi:flotillin
LPDQRLDFGQVLSFSLALKTWSLAQNKKNPMLQNPLFGVGFVAGVLIFAAFLIPAFIKSFLRDVSSGTIRMVTWWGGSMKIYRGPGKSFELPILTNGTTISSKAINVDLDITDQTADVDRSGVPNPIKVRVLASAIVSVGDSDELIKTAANRFFAKTDDEQMSTLTDLLSSSGRRAVNLLTHDQLFSAKSSGRTALLADREAQVGVPATVTVEEDDDPLAIIIRKACSRELTDLGLVFNSLNIKVVQSEVAEARRRQSAAEATANADIVAANQNRRAKEAQLEAERSISDKQRELEQTRLANAVLIAEAEAKRQDALAGQKESELRATQIAQAKADSEAVQIDAEAKAKAEAIRITTVATAQAEGIRKVTEAIRDGGENYLRYRQIELLPDIAPAIAQALAQAKLVTVHGGGDSGDAATATTDSIASVIRTVLAAQIVTRGGGLVEPTQPTTVQNDGERVEKPVSKRN